MWAIRGRSLKSCGTGGHFALCTGCTRVVQRVRNRETTACDVYPGHSLPVLQAVVWSFRMPGTGQPSHQLSLALAAEVNALSERDDKGHTLQGCRGCKDVEDASCKEQCICCICGVSGCSLPSTNLLLMMNLGPQGLLSDPGSHTHVGMLAHLLMSADSQVRALAGVPMLWTPVPHCVQCGQRHYTQAAVSTQA